MTINASFHDPKTAEHKRLPGIANDTLSFDGANGEHISLFVPEHVAEHTADAFNRAMQAVPTGKGDYQYTTERQIWFIKHEPGFGWHAQSDEITGDGDPSWMFADGKTLIGVMDEIDRIEAEEMEDAA